MPVCSSDFRPRADSSQLPEGFDPRLVELVDHLTLSISLTCSSMFKWLMFLDVPQPGVSGTVVPPPGPPQES